MPHPPLISFRLHPTLFHHHHHQNPNQDSDLLVITILDENDNRPIFTRTSYRAEITENTAAGSTQPGVSISLFPFKWTSNCSTAPPAENPHCFFFFFLRNHLLHCFLFCFFLSLWNLLPELLQGLTVCDSQTWVLHLFYSCRKDLQHMTNISQRSHGSNHSVKSFLQGFCWWR